MFLLITIFFCVFVYTVKNILTRENIQLESRALEEALSISIEKEREEKKQDWRHEYV